MTAGATPAGGPAAAPAGAAAALGGAGPPPAARPLVAATDALLACVHCGFCLNACPTYTRLGDEADSPRGRLHLMRAVVEGRLPPDDDAFVRHLDRCLGCRACEPVCPSGVEYGHLLERARESIALATRVPLPARLLLFAFCRPLPSRLTALLGRLLRGAGLARLLARGLPRPFRRARTALAMLAASAPWPRLQALPAGRATAESAAPLPAGPAAGDADAEADTAGPQPPPVRVATLRGCVQHGLFARVNAATEAVLRANGCTPVDAPGQRCCGALHAHGGAADAARALARTNIAAFEASGAELVVVNAAGCGAMMKDYGALLADDAAWRERAAGFASRVRDATELLAARGPRRGAPLDVRVTYDAPCHLLHGQRIDRAPLDVLAAIPGLVHLPLPRADECCGGAGIYGLLHADLGGRILADKVAAVRTTGADVVVTPNPGCAMQIGAGLLLAGEAVPVLHPLELLAESYRRLDTHEPATPSARP